MLELVPMRINAAMVSPAPKSTEVGMETVAGAMEAGTVAAGQASHWTGGAISVRHSQSAPGARVLDQSNASQPDNAADLAEVVSQSHVDPESYTL